MVKLRVMRTGRSWSAARVWREAGKVVVIFYSFESSV
jgi:hypothetical protein